MKFLVCAVLFLVTIKWLVVFLYIPFVSVYALYKKGNSNVKPLTIVYRGVERICKGGMIRYVLYHIGFIPSISIRKLLYIAMGAEIGKNAVLHFKTEIRDPWSLKLGEGTIIGDNAILDARRGLTLGKNVNLSSNVSIYTLQHDHRNPNFACFGEEKKMSVEIGDRVWLGSNVTILPGVIIGEGAVCCAGCVVTKDVAPFDVVAGIPAKKVGERPRNQQYEFKSSSCCWFY